MAKVPKLSGANYPQHTKQQEQWITRMTGDSWTIAAVLTADSSDSDAEQPITVVLRNRSEERKYTVDPAGAETLIALLPRQH